MFGILFGTACLIGLVAVVRGRRRHFHLGARHMFRELGLTPEQERDVAEATSRLRDAGWELMGSARQLRKGVARAVVSADDQDELERGFDAMTDGFAAFRTAVSAEVEGLRGRLDEAQRQRLSTWLLAPGLAWLGLGHRCHRGAHP